jgi:hypothetical protein
MNQKRGTVFRYPSNLDAIVRVYQHEPGPAVVDGMVVTTQPLTAIVDGETITVYARVIRPDDRRRTVHAV